MALLARAKTGRGQHVDIGMLDSTAALLTYQAASYFATGASPTRLGNRHPTIVPYETFAVADGDLVLAVGNDELWRSFCNAVGLSALASDERFATNRERVVNYDILKPLLDATLRTRSRAEWIALLNANGVPCGSVRSIGDVLGDPQIEARDMIAAVEHATLGPLRTLGVPIKLSDTPAKIRNAAPVLGQHTERILRSDLGLSDSEIQELRSAGAI
jgi:formyl-CoA transferase/CoA:oxalate CoA-transferase